MSPRYRAILAAVAAAHRVRVADILSDRRNSSLSFARFEAAYRLRELQRCGGRQLLSYPQIGKILNRDHTSIIHAVRRWPQVAESIGRPVDAQLEIERDFHIKEAARLSSLAAAHLSRASEIETTVSCVQSYPQADEAVEAKVYLAA